jgi:tRNA 2-selenouridine synthase
MALASLDPARPVVVEAESAVVGDLKVPGRLWAAMRAAPRVTIQAPLDARAGYLARAYADVTASRERLTAAIAKLRPFQPKEVIEGWLAEAEAGEFRALAAGLMQRHYDPRYEKHRERIDRAQERVVQAGGLAPDDLTELAQRVAEAVGAVAGRQG